MKITCDPGKNAANLARHGVSLNMAAELEWDTAVTWLDARKDYGEPRMCGIGYLGLRLYFVDRANGRRIISLRKANLRERNFYAEA